MSEQMRFKTRIWAFTRFYNYDPKDARKKKFWTRNFELTIVLEFPEDWSEYDIWQKDTELVNLATKIMEDELFQKANELHGHAADTWTRFYSKGGMARMDLKEDEWGIGRQPSDKARGLEKTEKTKTRDFARVECEDPDEPGRIIKLSADAWNEVYGVIFRSRVDYEAFYRRLKQKYDVDRDDARKLVYLARYKPKCKFIPGEATLQASWVVVDEQHHYDWGANHQIRGTVEYDTKTFWKK